MPSQLGTKVKSRRTELGLTLEGLAEKIGSTKSYVWELENKPAIRPSADKIFKLAEALKVTAEFLSDTSGKVQPKPTDFEVAFFRKYQKLDPEQKKMLNKFIESLDT